MVWGTKNDRVLQGVRDLSIYPLGTLCCPPKPNTKKYRHQVRETVLRNSDLGAHAIQQAEVGEAFVAGDI